MARVWKEGIAPKYLHDNFGAYHGIWMPQMDRCWFSDDGYQVTSRILITDWGKVEHAAITYNGDEEFGEKRLAIEVFPAETNKVDVMDVYHLWVFPKGFSMPFGIHPTKDKQCRVVNRGSPKDPTQLALNSQGMLSNTKDRNKSKTFLSHRRRLPPLQVASKK